MTFQRRSGHFPPTPLATYPGSLPFLKSGYLPRSSPLVLLNYLLPPNEPCRAYHCLGITQVFPQADSLKNSYHGRQCCLHPYRILPCYTTVILVKSYFVLSYCLSEPMLSLLGFTDLLEVRTDHCINYDIKNHWGYRVLLCHSSPRAEGTSIILP